MSLFFEVLGAAGRDNALLVKIDSGQSVARLLFDCGDGCLTELPFGEIQAIDEVFFSHLHMDHVGGFDSFFRCTFSRDAKANRVWGPPGTAGIMQHRFQGFLWNLHDQMTGTWRVSDVFTHEVRTSRFELQEAFEVAHEEERRPYERTVHRGNGFEVDVLTMDHRTASLAYVVREHPRQNIDSSRLAALGLPPGRWLEKIRDAGDPADTIEIGGAMYSVAELRQKLVIETPGDSLAYLTDFLLDELAIERLAKAVAGCSTIVCEGQYCHADLDLARKNYHMTTALSAMLAQKAQVGELVLFHLSDRYDQSGWLDMLREAMAIFPATRYPAKWGFDLST